MSIADELRKLQELRASGALTEEEFVNAKASVLGSPTTAAAAPPVDEKAERIRTQLEEFKGDFDSSDECSFGAPLQGTSWKFHSRSVLVQYEDLLLAVCGEERYASFLHDVEKLRDLAMSARDAKADGNLRARDDYMEQYESEWNTLFGRIKRIEYRG
jgi:hypothetical protein